MKTLPPSELLQGHIKQGGVLPGPRKLAQFKEALSLRGTPPFFGQAGQGDEAIAYVKLFDPCGSWTWFLTEWNGADEAFGLVLGQVEELGYVALPELAFTKGPLGIGIEIDVWFTPKTLREIQSAANQSKP